MNKTKIEWCDSTWNPVTGCLHGCEYCYAKRIAIRFGGMGVTVPRVQNEPYIINGRVIPYPFGFTPTFHRYRLDEPQKWKKPRTIFVCSMADLFGDWVPDEWIEEVFKACEKAPQHRYLFLTKNPRRYVELAKKGKLPERANIWYGSTATSSDKQLYLSSNRNTFLNIEPILKDFGTNIKFYKLFDWVIIGAETGNRRYKVIPEKEWIGNICKAANESRIPVFMKDSLIPIVGEENMRREFPWESGYIV